MWTVDNIPDLTGKRALITGVTGGLGQQTALELGRRGAQLVVTARDESKATHTLTWLHERVPDLTVDVVSVDLADLANTVGAADEVMRKFDHIDIAVNNAGIMVPPHSTTTDGFEMQIGTNHLGHFAWTGMLWPLLKSSRARIVTVSSLAHRLVRSVDLASLTIEGAHRRYHRWTSYGESKLANLLFMLELDRRAKAAGVDVVSVAAHPGFAATNLTHTGSQLAGRSLGGLAFHRATQVVAQSAAAGAQPQLMAATSPGMRGGEYVGPRGFQGLRGRPTRAAMSRSARDPELAERLWEASESATGVAFDV